MRPNRLGACVLICVSFLLSAQLSGQVEVDTNRVREPRAPDKSLGEGVADVVSEVLKLPIYPVKGIVRGGVWAVYDSPLRHIIFAPAPDVSAYPIVSYGSNPGWKGGLGFYAKHLLHRNDILRTKVYYSTHDYQRYSLRYEGPKVITPRLGTWLHFDYRKRPWESFYGLGTDTPEIDEVSYSLEQTRAEIGLRYSPVDRLSLDVAGGWLGSNITDGQNDDRPRTIDSIVTILELTADDYRSSRLVFAHIGLSHDFRNHPGRPTAGGRLHVGASYYFGTGRSKALKFLDWQLEYGHYLELFNGRVLFLRGRYQRATRAAGDPRIPFYLQSTLGGDDGLLGYRGDRFVDNDLILLTAEYRWPLWQVVDALLILEEGQVMQSLADDFRPENLRYSVSVGMRIWGQYGESPRLLVSRSDEATRFYLEMGADW